MSDIAGTLLQSLQQLADRHPEVNQSIHFRRLYDETVCSREPLFPHDRLASFEDHCAVWDIVTKAELENPKVAETDAWRGLIAHSERALDCAYGILTDEDFADLHSDGEGGK